MGKNSHLVKDCYGAYRGAPLAKVAPEVWLVRRNAGDLGDPVQRIRVIDLVSKDYVVVIDLDQNGKVEGESSSQNAGGGNDDATGKVFNKRDSPEAKKEKSYNDTLSSKADEAQRLPISMKFSELRETDFVLIDNRNDEWLKTFKRIRCVMIDDSLGTYLGDKYSRCQVASLTDRHNVVVDNRPDARATVKIDWPLVSIQSHYGAERVLARQVNAGDIVSVEGNPALVTMAKSTSRMQEREIIVTDQLTGETKKKLYTGLCSPVFRALHIPEAERKCKNTPFETSVWAVRSVPESSGPIILVHIENDVEQLKEIEWPLPEKTVNKLRRIFKEFGEQTTVSIAKVLRKEYVSRVDTITDRVLTGEADTPIGNYELDVPAILAEKQAQEARKKQAEDEKKKKRIEEASKKRKSPGRGSKVVTSTSTGANGGHQPLHGVSQEGVGTQYPGFSQVMPNNDMMNNWPSSFDSSGSDTLALGTVPLGMGHSAPAGAARFTEVTAANYNMYFFGSSAPSHPVEEQPSGSFSYQQTGGFGAFASRSMDSFSQNMGSSYILDSLRTNTHVGVNMALSSNPRTTCIPQSCTSTFPPLGRLAQRALEHTVVDVTPTHRISVGIENSSGDDWVEEYGAYPQQESDYIQSASTDTNTAGAGWPSGNQHNNGTTQQYYATNIQPAATDPRNVATVNGFAGGLLPGSDGILQQQYANGIQAAAPDVMTGNGFTGSLSFLNNEMHQQQYTNNIQPAAMEPAEIATVDGFAGNQSSLHNGIHQHQYACGTLPVATTSTSMAGVEWHAGNLELFNSCTHQPQYTNVMQPAAATGRSSASTIEGFAAITDEDDESWMREFTDLDGTGL